jgi:hypothetical protein
MFKRRNVPFLPVTGTSWRPRIWPKVLIGLTLLWRASGAVAGLNAAEIADPRFADEASGPGLRRAAKLTFASAAPARADDRNRMATYVRLDNDSFAGSDRGYTSGIRIGFTSPTVASFDDSSLPAPLRWLDRRLAWMQPRGFEDYNVTLAIGQGMFTPEDWRLSVPDPLDRPYAGVLVASATYNGRDARSMRSTTLELGLVGPSTFAEQTQDFLHDRLGSDEFRGWNHQLRDEPVARIIHQRLRKRVLARGPGMADAIVHHGGSIGNLATFANAGVELRFGRTLPDNFGTAPGLPAVENTAPSRTPLHSRRVSVHGYLALDAKYMLHNITLDGNTWRDSASVEREEFVADAGVGIAMYWRGWKLTLARYFRTKEFATQRADTKLGSFTLRRELAGR